MRKTHKLSTIIFFIVFNIAVTTAFSPIHATNAATATNESVTTTSDSFLNVTNWPVAPDIIGEAALLIEAKSGVVLYEKNSKATMYPASITKLITALLVLENCELNEMVPFSAKAVFSLPAGASHIAINPGEELSVEHCLYGLLLASANEVANALAEYVGGSMDDFSVLMNNRMKELGAENTNFVNPSGLHEDEHYTTCHDMALLCRELIKNKTFLKINGTTSYIIPPTNLQPLKRPINTTHKLLRKGSINYSGAFGGKTGHTDIAGNTLITFAERNDMTLICVVMKSDSTHVYSDTTALLDYGFSYFKEVDIAASENSFDFTQNLISNSDYTLFSNPNPTLSLSNNSYVYIPVNAEFEDLEYTLTSENDTDGVFSRITYTFNGHFVGEAYLLASASDIPDTSERDLSSEEEIPLKIIEILPIHIIILVSVIVLIIALIIYFKLTRVTRLRRKRIRRQKRQQRQKLR
ncbi:MAG: D-alanyl-D-alanine carboxypeptidase [Lachnospiraceae bacterium]|nr:D-alanyl-D-alanine carboxypeptidase [Lachnospiraceae bacterium]